MGSSSGSNEFDRRLRDYLSEVSKANSEASKAFLFTEFVREVFKGINADYAERLYPQLEKQVRIKKGTVIVSGRIDALLGNLIIEFEVTLDDRKLSEAKDQLKKYIAALWTGQTQRVEWLAVATDGVKVKVLRPTTSAEPGVDIGASDVALEPVDSADLTEMLNRFGSDRVFVWLDRYVLFRQMIPPSTEEFVGDFGAKSPRFNAAMLNLEQMWHELAGTGAETLYEEWARYLDVVYGSRVESEGLFIKHTYLATVAKLIAYMFYSGGILPSPEEIEKVIRGDAFREWGIQGFLEEDFFSWILRDRVRQQGMKLTDDLLEGLKRYDLGRLEEDVLKGLYQELMDPEERHDLGEYYTPEWLAETIVEGTLATAPKATVLDPACGSGTFLAATIRFKKAKLTKERRTKLLYHILDSVKGIDIHPLAVITSRVNFLLALGDLIKHKVGSIAIPVYMADSLRLPGEVKTAHGDIDVYVVKAQGKRAFLLPLLVAKDPKLHDEVLDAIRDYVTIAAGRIEKESLGHYLKQVSPGIRELLEKNPALEEGLIETLYAIAGLLRDLHLEGRDTIWAFILKNIFKPLYLKERKIDVIVGNPPWLSYRYVRSAEYQEDLKKMMITNYQLLSSEKAELITQMELATLFFTRTADLYLKDTGKLTFVMPRGIFSADQHAAFREGIFRPVLGLNSLVDLLRVKPLFNVPACVVYARKGQRTNYPVQASILIGALPKKNMKLNDAKAFLQKRQGAFHLNKLGQRSFLAEKLLLISKERSPYYPEVYQGASVVPRSFWFVEFKRDPRLGINPQAPFVETSKRAREGAKDAYADVILAGKVESDFIYAVLTGSELVPFATLPPNYAVLPMIIGKGGYEILSANEASRRGWINLSKWVETVQTEWEKRRGEKAERMSALEWLDYKKKLSRQNPDAKYLVVYNTSGTYLASCVVEKRSISFTLDGVKFRLNGIILDTTVYYRETADANEAHYLTTILNSKFIDDIIKPAQARGAFGPRHFHKKPLELPIPKYNATDPIHVRLSELGLECAKISESVVPKLKKYKSIGKIRSEVKAALASQLDEIDALVIELFAKESPTKNPLDRFMTSP